MKTRTKIQPPAFVLRSWNGWTPNSLAEVPVTWAALKAAKVGTIWDAVDTSNCVRASHSESATVVYKDDRGVAVLHRVWGTSDDAEPHEFEEIELVWYEFRGGGGA